MKTWTKKFQKMLTLYLPSASLPAAWDSQMCRQLPESQVQPTMIPGINGKKGGTITTNGTKYYMSGTRKAICKGNTLTMYASFNTSKNGILNSQNKKAYIKYGKHTFKLTSKTKYYFSGGEAPNDYCSKSAFMSTMRSMNGLGLRIKVTNGKVVEMSFQFMIPQKPQSWKFPLYGFCLTCHYFFRNHSFFSVLTTHP